ncbi:hypothetical protein ACMU_08805 [Actibacterium mucosum KCTC 23349]|uniref:DUF1468 domain-containing protein n=2 Tax=Actibacterium TaxID=1433986 RepID=A0A037ZM15_9RHOB|nr:hypothetical protein ACMU_08805 [Actibacterium mucosum KCTC 23349]
MPRFEDQGAPVYQAPGLTPGLLGVALAVSGAILALRRGRDGAQTTTFWQNVFGAPQSRRRAGAAVVLTVIYGAVLFGNTPYLVATFLFVTAFVLVFEIGLNSQNRTKGVVRSVIVAIVLGVVTSLGTRFLFETLFLIQLS